MKYLYIILLLICGLTCRAQDKPIVAKFIDSNLIYGTVKPFPILNKYSPPERFEYPDLIIDSVKADASLYLSYINPNDIAAINIIKNSVHPKGLMDMKLKDHKLLLKLLKSDVLSLNTITNTYAKGIKNNKQVIYLLNDKLITDTINVRIPSACLYSITIAKASETPYFKTALPNVLLMMVKTSFVSMAPYQPDIMIKGIAAKN